MTEPSIEQQISQEITEKELPTNQEVTPTEKQTTPRKMRKSKVEQLSVPSTTETRIRKRQVEESTPPTSAPTQGKSKENKNKS